MKKIIRFLIEHIRDEFHPGYYFLTFLYLGIAIYLNYAHDLKQIHIDNYYGEASQYLRYFILFSLSYYLPAFLYALFNKDHEAIKKPAFWGISLFTLIVLAADSASSTIYYDLKIIFGIPRSMLRWTFYLFTSFHQAVMFTVPIIFYKILFDNNEKKFYGLTAKNFDLKPYFTMLLIMAPFIVLASYQPDFMAKYPVYTPGYSIEKHMLPWLAAGSFEFSYAIRFFTIEIFFRGFMVIGISRLIGHRAVMPMAVLYSLWHFGKPLAETISAFFGGYLLGVIAFRTKSIWGGVIAHIGIALMMELAAYLQIYGIMP